MKLALRRAAVAAFAVSVIAAPIALAGDKGADPPPAPVTYAIIGDTPYGSAQITNFPTNDIPTINSDPNVSLVLHVGDIKNGSTECNNIYLRLIRTDFNLFQDPLVYTPGDNEWTDCHRPNNGGYLPDERLDTVRWIFFDTPGQTLGVNSMSVDYQKAPYVENVSWNAAGVQWGTLNVPGSNNDWGPWFNLPQTQAQVDEFKKRNEADLKWLRSIFDSARKSHASAVVLGIQANMWDPVFTGLNDSPASYDHFTDFVQELAKQTTEFGKPVLLFNGDSHEFTDDMPLSASAPAYQLSMYGLTNPVPNLRRITVNGSTTCPHEWLKLTVDTSASSIFTYERKPFPNQAAIGC